MKRSTASFLLLCVLLAACAKAQPEQPDTQSTVELTEFRADETETTGNEVTEETADTTASATEADTTAPGQETTSPASEPTQPTQGSEQPTQPTQSTQPTTEPATLPTEPVTQTTEPEKHSELYIPDVSVESVIGWYNEVVLDAEFTHGGNASLVQKWGSAICYTVSGEPTEEDLQLLSNFCYQLNMIPGFPGIREAAGIWESNLDIFFCPQSEFSVHLGSGYEGLDGGVRFWYDGGNRIYDGVICVRSDMDQYVRNSVLKEEIYNGLGPVQDTWQRGDSIIYAGYSTPQSLTTVDWLILKLLYNPSIQCGMTASQCESVIRSLYY